MADKSVLVRLRADITDYSAKMKAAGNDTEKVAAVNKQAAHQLNGALTTMGVGLVGLSAVAVKSFADFDKQMSAVAATGDEARNRIDALRDAAIKAGASTAFSATEAAQGIEELAKAGLTTTDILKGGLAGALDLAAAGGISVAEAAESTSIAMQQFGLKGEQATHVADLLAAGAGKAVGDVSDMSQALNQAGLVANQTGLSIEETTGTLAAFASQGLLGSDAGTSFKTMLQRLSAPTKEVRALMDDLNISAYDAQGNFVGMEKFAGSLEQGLRGMTEEQKNATLATIFGSDAVRAASVIYDEGAAGIAKWIDDVDDSGYAAETAATKLDNLAGDVEAFKGALETALIGAGEGANGPLRSLVSGATDVVNVFNSMPDVIQQSILMLTGGTGLVALGVVGFGKLYGASKETLGALEQMGILSERSTGKLSRGMGRATRVIGAATAALGVFAVAAQVAGTGMDDIADSGRIADQFEGLAKGSEDATKNLEKMFTVAGSSGAKLDGLGYSLKVLDQNGFVKFLDNAGSLFGVFDSEGRLAAEAINNFDAALAQTVAAGNVEDAAAAIEYYKDAAKEQGVAVDDAMANLPLYQEAMDASAAAQDELGDATGTTTGEMGEQNEELQKQLDLQKATTEAILAARDGQRGLEQAIDDGNDALKENGKTLDLNTQKGRDNQEALDGILDRGTKYIEQLREQGASQEDIDKAVDRTRNQFIKLAEAMGMAPEEAKALADEIGLVKADIQVGANTDAAVKDSEEAAEKIATLTSIIQVFGDTAPARKEGESAEDYISRLQAVFKTDSDTRPARKEGEKAQKYIDRLKAYITADGDAAPARKEGEDAEKYINRLEGVIDVEADTDPADDTVNDWIKKARKTVVEIGSKFLPGFFGSGDGEGMGWPGGAVPHGVGQMSAAVQQIDPSARISSGYRPGAITATGYPSYHGMGRAIDIVSPNMGRTFDMLVRAFGPRAKELYYTPRGFIRNGQWTNDVAAVTRRTHNNHVHLALNQGGRLPGNSPADPREDNLLGVDEHGYPRVRVRSREWVVNEPSSDYYGDGLMSAINSRAIPREALERSLYGLDRGMPGLASGGAVGSAERALESARKRRDTTAAAVLRSRRHIKELERAVKAAEKTDRESDDKAAEKRLKAAEKLLKERENRLDKQRDEVSEQSNRLRELRSTRTSVSRDLRRGNIRDAVTSGSGYSVIDQMYDLRDSGNLTSGQRARLQKNASTNETKLRSLYKEAERLDKKLQDANDKVQELEGIRDTVKGAITGGFSLASGVTTSTDPWTGVETTTMTGKTVLANTQAYAAKAKKLAGILDKLQAAGFAGPVLQEVATSGTVEEGIALGEALLELNVSDRKALNTAYSDIAKWGSNAGQQVTEGFYKGGLSAAQGLVKGLEDSQEDVEAAILRIAKSMEGALKAALGIKSPSRVFRKLMRWVGEGTAQGLDDQQPLVGKSAAALLSTVDKHFNPLPSPVRVNVAGGGVEAGSPEGVSKADLVELAEMIVTGFETGSVRQLQTYTRRQNMNRVMVAGTTGR